ncbi:MAG: GH3 auxin-responsive promoter family protein [Sphingobacteriales bacterium]|nr:MAG: GH3 auxin-responsive promoter family protein [Sphingobacteriales bacterium]
MNYLTNRIIRYLLHRHIKQVYAWLDNPLHFQRLWFRQLIDLNKNTVWGKTYGYDKIKTQRDFAGQVPLQDYDSLKPFFQRTLNGEQSVIWHHPIQWFAKSSGTTSDKSKFLPLSPQAIRQCHISASRDMMALFIQHNPQTRIFSGKSLILGGSHEISKHNRSARYGDLSAVLLNNMPYLGNLLRTPGNDISLLPDWDEKIEKTARLIINQPVTNFAGVPTWFLVLFKRVLELTGKQHLREVWPGLSLYLHGGVSFTPYKHVFKQLIPADDMEYWQTYNASEGFFALQDQPNRNDMALLVNHGIYFEFLPMSELESNTPQTLTLEEVETGKNYALVITTNAGLWRYLPGDTIMFTTLNPYRIRVTGRTRHYINAFGEELIVDNADMAIETASFKTNAKVQEYTAAPVYFSESGNGGHEWLIEFTQAPPDLQEFARHLDTTLKQVNSDYEAKRYQDMAMQFPVVTAVPAGTFYRWMKSKGKLGGQHKVPRLANDRQYLEEIKQFFSPDK